MYLQKGFNSLKHYLDCIVDSGLRRKKIVKGALDVTHFTDMAILRNIFTLSNYHKER